MTGSITVHLVATLVPLTVGIFYGWMIKKCISSRWYVNLKKPAFHPPAWLIAISFAIVNALMGYASALICAIERSPYHFTTDANGRFVSSIGTREGLTHLHKLAILAYLIQFFLNGVWPIIFFATRNIPLTLFPIIIVDAATIFTCRLFYESSVLAGALSLPHLSWLLLWTLVIFSLWFLNGDSNGSYEKLVTKGTMTPHFITQISITQIPVDGRQKRRTPISLTDDKFTSASNGYAYTANVSDEQRQNNHKCDKRGNLTYGTLKV